MIHSVNGKLIHIELGLAVVECGGVGYACRTTSGSLDGLKTGDDVVFLIHMSVREDAVELFGFITAYELNCFKMLLSVSGVGPKAALSILSEMSPQNFALSVVADDVKSLTRVKGIGAKTAQLIILKLKDKLSGETASLPRAGNMTGSSAGSPVSADAQAVSALMVLGFSASEAATALAGLSEELDTSEKIKQALKKLSVKR
ncbi:MAG: Holliday junction branch migration protein RuvA [Oscillospiraceae bacterium]|nr:Holliday junction branch migration protein RuvA [Oscillospiraceae bacterium]